MLIDVDAGKYAGFFPSNPHAFISEEFISLNSGKAEKIVRLVENNSQPRLGLVAGIKSRILMSPFSAPFGGFHFKNSMLYISEIDNYVQSLQEYLSSEGLGGIEISLPPDIYHFNFNSKIVNSLIRNNFKMKLPELTNYVVLEQFQKRFAQKNSREAYAQSVRNGLSFELTTNVVEQIEIYSIIQKNREKFGRPIYMSFEDVQKTSELWSADFFKVVSSDDIMVASAIFYRNHPEICFALFWGDTDLGRSLKAMDYMIFNLWSYYKDMGFKYIDLGISTEAGIPNEGLLRFKEMHESNSSLRFSLSWSVK